MLSPSFAASGTAPAVHEQAMRRLTEVTGVIPVEYPTTRQLRASPADRAADLNAAFADPEIRAVLATIGGEDQITVVPYLDALKRGGRERLCLPNRRAREWLMRGSRSVSAVTWPRSLVFTVRGLSHGHGHWRRRDQVAGSHATTAGIVTSWCLRR